MSIDRLREVITPVGTVMDFQSRTRFSNSLGYVMRLASCIESHVSEQVDVNELKPSQVRDEAERYARKEVASQMAQFQEFGIMANWGPDTTYRTLGDHMRVHWLQPSANLYVIIQTRNTNCGNLRYSRQWSRRA